MACAGVLLLALALASCGDDETRSGVDLTVDAASTAESLAVSVRDFAADDCALVEGAIPAPGRRRLLQFDTVIVNRGTRDLVIGDPAHPMPPFAPGNFEFSPCHGHFHFEGFASYELRDAAGRVVGAGHKQSFCIADFRPFDDAPSQGYTCAFQGLSVEWADRYDRELDGQWVDVTEVPAGEYTLVVTVNPEHVIPEPRDEAPNEARIAVRLAPPPDAGGPAS